MLRSACRICIDETTRIRNRLLNLIDTPILVLIYHRVTTLQSDPQQLAVSPDNFLKQMRFIKNNFPVLRFEDDWSKLQEPSIVITFDDGYADNVTEALPVLEEVGVPATFFVSTGGLGSNRDFWWDELERIILEGEVLPDLFELLDSKYGGSWPTGNSTERKTLYQEIYPLIKRMDTLSRNNCIKQLHAWAGTLEEGRATHRVMTFNELYRLASCDLATIGAHTVSHPTLAMLSSAEQQREINESKRQLEEWTGREITVFSYPFGGKGDYTAETVRLCHEAGFIKAASNFPGQVRRWTDPYQLPRQLVRNWDADTFAMNMGKFLVC